MLGSWAEDGIKKTLVLVPEECAGLNGKAIIVTDAARTGKTLAESVRSLTAAGATVTRMFCLFNYQSGTEQTLAEALKDMARRPSLDFMLRRDDPLFLRDWRRPLQSYPPRQAALNAALGCYLTGPIRHVINRLHSQYVHEGRPPGTIIVSTKGENTTDVQEGFERALLRLSLEAEMYPPEQTTGVAKGDDRLPPHLKAYAQDYARARIDLCSKMDTLRSTYLGKSGRDLPWMKALPHMLRETLEDAVRRRFSLNSTGDEHTRHVRDVFRLLKKHQPGIPYDLFGLPDWKEPGDI